MVQTSRSLLENSEGVFERILQTQRAGERWKLQLIPLCPSRRVCCCSARLMRGNIRQGLYLRSGSLEAKPAWQLISRSCPGFQKYSHRPTSGGGLGSGCPQRQTAVSSLWFCCLMFLSLFNLMLTPLSSGCSRTGSVGEDGFRIFSPSEASCCLRGCLPYFLDFKLLFLS